MTRERIEQTVRAFVAAAARARTAGFDCVELHAAHGYLLSQFLCPAENYRRDEYGGSIENRARLSLEIVTRIKSERERFSRDFSAERGRLFPERAAVRETVCRSRNGPRRSRRDALHVTAGHYRSLPSAHMMTPPMNCPEGIFLEYAARVKAEVAVPVIAVGRLGDPSSRCDAVDSGKADFVALGRPLIADPDWVAKAQGNAVRRCLACNKCVDEMRGGDKLRLRRQSGCRAGNWTTRRRVPAARGRAYRVIGAGPAGLSYAAARGRRNNVTVFEGAAHGRRVALRRARAAVSERGSEPATRSTLSWIDSNARASENGCVFALRDRDPERQELVHRDFDRMVVATGAQLPAGPRAVVIDLARRLGQVAPRAARLRFAASAGIGSIIGARRALSRSSVNYPEQA